MNNLNIIGSQEHRINMTNSGIIDQISLTQHISNNSLYYVGDYLIVENGNPPHVVATFQIVKGLREVNLSPETERDSDDSDNNSDNDEDTVRAIRQPNNAMTPIPTSGLRFENLNIGNRTIIPRGGKMKSNRSRKKKKTNTKKRKTTRRVRKKK